MKNLFEFIAGSVCLDFVDTVDQWLPSGDGSVTIHDDTLTDYESLVRWSFEAKIISDKQARAMTKRAAADNSAASKVLARALKLR